MPPIMWHKSVKQDMTQHHRHSTLKPAKAVKSASDKVVDTPPPTHTNKKFKLGTVETD